MVRDVTDNNATGLIRFGGDGWVDRCCASAAPNQISRQAQCDDSYSEHSLYWLVSKIIEESVGDQNSSGEDEQQRRPRVTRNLVWPLSFRITLAIDEDCRRAQSIEYPSAEYDVGQQLSECAGRCQDHRPH